MPGSATWQVSCQVQVRRSGCGGFRCVGADLVTKLRTSEHPHVRRFRNQAKVRRQRVCLGLAGRHCFDLGYEILCVWASAPPSSLLEQSLRRGAVGPLLRAAATLRMLTLYVYMHPQTNRIASTHLVCRDQEIRTMQRTSNLRTVSTNHHNNRL